MSIAIRFTAGRVQIDGSLNDSQTARKLAELLPITVRMRRWGDEYYGEIVPGLNEPESESAREEMRIGELAYWPVGEALCVFFGPTPASSGDEPRAASPVNPIGSLDGDLGSLNSLPSSIEAHVEKI